MTEEPNQQLRTAALSIVEASHSLYARGWSPASSSNFSVRLGDDACAITVSGKDKGDLVLEDVMPVDLNGNALDDRKPSAETLLHTSLYQHDASIGAVLHTHSVLATCLSMIANEGLDFHGIELLKAFEGIESHLAILHIPVFDNTQDIAALADEVNLALKAGRISHAYLIRGHGVYTWGRDIRQAMRQLEALEFLFDYSWHMMQYKAGVRAATPN